MRKNRKNNCRGYGGGPGRRGHGRAPYNCNCRSCTRIKQQRLTCTCTNDYHCIAWRAEQAKMGNIPAPPPAPVHPLAMSRTRFRRKFGCGCVRCMRQHDRRYTLMYYPHGAPDGIGV